MVLNHPHRPYHALFLTFVFIGVTSAAFSSTAGGLGYVPLLSSEGDRLGSEESSASDAGGYWESGLLMEEPSSSWHREKRALGKAWTGTTSLATAGTTGVSAMQISVVSDDAVLILDKFESNPLQISGHSAAGAIYTISTKKVRALDLQTNSFCAGGGWLGNGTMASLGGNPVENEVGGQKNGIQAVRLMEPCSGSDCKIYENPSRIRLTSARWYPSTVRLTDGSLLVIGGMVTNGFNNNATTDNPTLEFFPPKGDGLAIASKFLHDALNTNLFPISFLLPDGRVFVAANTMSMIYNPTTNKEQRLPAFPNGVKVNYPASAASAVLPFTIANNWASEILICGGTNTDVDRVDYWHLSSQTAASSQCVRMRLSTAGIAGGWLVEQLPEARVMGDAVLTPDGKVMILNGAGTGVAGYGNVGKRVGASNADHPVYRPVLYDPVAKSGSRFSTNFPSSKIERLYHSSATLLPDGRIFVAGSNPNGDVSTLTYATRYNVEIFSPPYISLTRPNWKLAPTQILYAQRQRLKATWPADAASLQVVIMDLGYSTHGVHMNNRHVELKVDKIATDSFYITGPASAGLYPPGWGWIYVLADGVPSKGTRVMIGNGSGPPVSQSAITNLLAKTSASS